MASSGHVAVIVSKYIVILLWVHPRIAASSQLFAYYRYIRWYYAVRPPAHAVDGDLMAVRGGVGACIVDAAPTMALYDSACCRQRQRSVPVVKRRMTVADHAGSLGLAAVSCGPER